MIFLSLAACVSTTGGERITFDVVAEPAAPIESDGTIAYDDGDWHVVITTAKVSVGPAYFWSGKPLHTASLWDLIVPVAYADIDHFDYGFLRGEIVTQASIDLLSDEAVVVGTGDGLSGQAQSAELWLAPTADLDGTFVVAGTATNEDLTVAFKGALSIDDTVVDESAGQTAQEQRKVRGIPFDAEMTQGGTVRIGIDATRWLRGADFADLVDEAPDADGVYDIAHGTTVWSRWYAQVRQSGSTGPWTLAWTAE